MSDLLMELGLEFLGASGRSIVRYFIVCGGGFAIFWVLLSKRLEHRKIQSIPGAGRSVHLAEIRDSVYSLVVMSVVTALSLYGYDKGWIQIYMDPFEHGIPWLVASLVLFVFGFDTCCYWAHRLMHHPSLYKYLHEKHHVYTDPTPFAAYSFTTGEALAYAIFTPLILLVIPVNFWVLVVAGSWFTLASAGVHLGYELMPSWWGKSVFTRWIGTATMHNMHHEFVHHNFALYFTFWDRVCGTMHKDYDETLEDLTAQPLLSRPDGEASA